MRLLPGMTNSALNGMTRLVGSGGSGLRSDFYRVHRWTSVHATCGLKSNLSFGRRTAAAAARQRGGERVTAWPRGGLVRL